MIACLPAVAALKITPKCSFCNWQSHCLLDNKVITKAGGDATKGIKWWIMVFLKICHKAPVSMSWVKTTQSESTRETGIFKIECRKEERVILSYIITGAASGNSMDILLWGYKGNFFGFDILGKASYFPDIFTVNFSWGMASPFHCIVTTDYRLKSACKPCEFRCYLPSNFLLPDFYSKKTIRK